MANLEENDNLSNDGLESNTNLSNQNESDMKINTEQDVPLSKRAAKRLKKKTKWNETKHLKRLKEKMQKKEKIKNAILNHLPLGPSRKELKKSATLTCESKIAVTIDLSFDHLMSEKDVGKTIKQILHIYSLNRRSNKPLQLHISSFNGSSKKEMAKHIGYENWNVKFYEQNYSDIFEKDRLIYLTSESPNVIEKLEDNKVYIIGGLVDHNQHKGICYKIASEQGLNHGQLPINDFVKMKSRKVLTIDHVYEILLRVNEGLSWEDAFFKVLPQRKGLEKKIVNEGSTSINQNETFAN